MKLDRLTQKLDVKENPALETTDPQLADIANLAQEREFAEAGKRVGMLLDDGIYDLRLIPYYLFHHFEKDGIEGLKAIFQTFTAILKENWPAFGPEKNKDQHADAALSWFAKNLNKEFKHHEKFNDRTYKAWIRTAKDNKLAGVVEAGQALRAAVVEAIDAPTGLEYLDRSLRWIADTSTFLREGSQATTAGAELNVDQSSESKSAQAELAGKENASQTMNAEPSMPLVEGSQLMKELLRRLQVFAVLVENGEHFKASLVAMDIDKRLNEFDPMEYFPKLFSTYTRLMSQHIGTIASFWQSQESLAWKATKKFYEVDLQSFIDSDIPPPHHGG
jgi:hypothetical protein